MFSYFKLKYLKWAFLSTFLSVSLFIAPFCFILSYSIKSIFLFDYTFLSILDYFLGFINNIKDLLDYLVSFLLSKSFALQKTS